MTNTQSIRTALERAERLVTTRPERGQRVYRNVATLTHGTRCLIEEGGHTLAVDAPTALGGEATGPTPVTLLRSAFTSCIAVGIKQWAARRNVEVDAVGVILETDVDARGQFGLCPHVTPGFSGIRLAITVTSPAPRVIVEEIVAVSLRFSPLMDVFVNPNAVETVVSVTGAEAATA